MSEQPKDITSPLIDLPGEITLVLEFSTFEFASPGTTLTLREPDGTKRTMKCLDVKPGKGSDGEYQEVCTIGPVKTTPPEPPA